MIGILLALQVNNWNEQRKTQKREFKLVSQLITDARADSIFFSSRIQYQQVRDTVYQGLINLGKGMAEDSFLNSEVRREPFFYRLAYQSNLINNNPNAYDVVSDEDIKNKLREYIKRYDYISVAIELSNRTVETYGVPLQIKYYEQLSEMPERVTIKDYLFAAQDKETLATIEIFRNFGINYYKQCVQFLEINHELIGVLKSYLEDNKD
jgi:hypothetical protein